MIGLFSLIKAIVLWLIRYLLMLRREAAMYYQSLKYNVGLSSQVFKLST